MPAFSATWSVWVFDRWCPLRTPSGRSLGHAGGTRSALAVDSRRLVLGGPAWCSQHRDGGLDPTLHGGPDPCQTVPTRPNRLGIGSSYGQQSSWSTAAGARPGDGAAPNRRRREDACIRRRTPGGRSAVRPRLCPPPPLTSGKADPADCATRAQRWREVTRARLTSWTGSSRPK
jgi:hypothetical protein